MTTFVKASHLLVKTEEEALKLKEEIAAGKDFAKAAQEVSLCPSGQNAQTQHRLIGLVCVFKELHTPGGSAHEHRQNTCCHRVKGAAVADASGLKDTSQLGSHILACPVLGLINNDNSIHMFTPV